MTRRSIQVWCLLAALLMMAPQRTRSEAADSAPNRITTTFYGDTTSQRAFTWYSTADSQRPVAVLSTSRTFPNGSSTMTFKATAHTNAAGERFFRAVATRLQPGTTYYYRLGFDDRSLWSATGSFLTSRGNGDFAFIVLADTQAADRTEAELAAATLAKSLRVVPGAEFVMHNGDVVEHGEREQAWIDLLGASQQSLLSTTLAPAAGDHDQAFADHFTLDARGSQDTKSGTYYSFDYNDAHFIVLNTNESAARGISDSQLAWLKSDARAARANGAKWLILNMHKGLYTPADHLDDAEIVAMRAVLVPVIDELDIDLVLQGHDHILSRTKVLASDPKGVAGARVIDTPRFTEMVNGKRIEYAVDPQGTIYFLPNTAGAKHSKQMEAPGPGIDLEAYFSLFDRLPDAAAARETFAAIRVTNDRLTVEQYDIRGGTAPRLFEGFGIDRQISPVDRLIVDLPTADRVTLADAPAVAAARAAADKLTPDQRRALPHLAKLEDAEQRLRLLAGLVSSDGSIVAWADRHATSRQPITVRNDTRTGFTDVPVRVTLAAAPHVQATQLSFFTPDGVPLSFEIETWSPGKPSTVWVKVPVLPKRAAAIVWAYFGGGAPHNDPTNVWSDGYALVDHMNVDTASAGQRPDSTGKAVGRLRGPALTAATSERGTAETRFAGSRIEYAGNIGGDYDQITVSGLYTFTAADVARFSGAAPVIAKESFTNDGPAAFAQAVDTDNKITVVLKGNSFQFPDVDDLQRLPLAVDGKPHLITQTYDGMTYSVFIDGSEAFSTMIEYRTTFSDPGVLTTIGDRYTNDGTPSSPFHGSIDEVHITGTAFTPEYESFRYANYFGDAVALGDRVERANEPLSLVVGTPRRDAAVEAGLVEVTGTVNKHAVLTARVGADAVFRQQIDAGVFAVKIPVNLIGHQTVVFEATATSNSHDVAAPVSVPLAVSDTTAPRTPLVSDTSAQPAATNVTLSVTPRTNDLERVEARFFANRLIDVSATNVTVRVGRSTDRVPDRLLPSSGELSADLLPTTVGENSNPFQIYELSLTPAQAAQDQFHLTWRGTGDTRRVSAWVWNNGAAKWLLKDSAYSASGAAVVLDVTALAAERAVAGGKLRILIWRGLTTLPWASGHDHTRLPEAGDYEWGLEHVGDTQLYSQATPARFVDQMAYVAAMAKTRKTALMVQVGDWVNREYYSQEYQWIGAESAIRGIEQAHIPYLIAWGNHDYSDLRNGRVMLPHYFPMSRLAASLDGSPWRFGGSHGIADYYYTGEIAGAKLLVLALGYFSVDSPDDPGVAWAKGVIAAHPDHTVIFAAHNTVGAGTNTWSNKVVATEIVEPHDNVKLVLGGHIAGTGIATNVNASGRRAYGVLTDYQSRVYGGQEFMKHVSIDAENGLIYFNTYSPMLDRTVSDGRWHQSVNETDVPGFHGADTENYVLELDLGSRTTRTLKTEALSLAAGAPVQVGTMQTRGSETASVVYKVPATGVRHEWYVELTDAAGHVTRGDTSSFVLKR